MGEIDYLLANISYMEGRYKQGLIHQMNAHKLIRSLGMWSKSAQLTYKLLGKLQKIEDIDKFLDKIFNTLQDCRNNKKEFENINL